MLSRRDDLQHLFDHLARILSGHGFAQGLLDLIDNVALGLERFPLRVKLHVSFLQLRHCYSHLLLDRRQPLRGNSRLHSCDFDRALQLGYANRVTGSLSADRCPSFGELPLQLAYRGRAHR